MTFFSKFTRKARGQFAMLIETGLHLIKYNLRHICVWLILSAISLHQNSSLRLASAKSTPEITA